MISVRSVEVDNFKARWLPLGGWERMVEQIIQGDDGGDSECECDYVRCR